MDFNFQPVAKSAAGSGYNSVGDNTLRVGKSKMVIAANLATGYLANSFGETKSGLKQVALSLAFDGASNALKVLPVTKGTSGSFIGYFNNDVYGKPSFISIGIPASIKKTLQRGDYQAVAGYAGVFQLTQ